MNFVPQLRLTTAAVSAALALLAPLAQGSSHRDAPATAGSPRIDASDFYMFRSYESSTRADYITLIANYQPMQDPRGGPHFYGLDPNALYEIHIDNNGDAKEDITFQFRLNQTLGNSGRGLAQTIGPNSVAIPLAQMGLVRSPGDANLNVTETYTVNIVRGDRRTGVVSGIAKQSGSRIFEKPADYIGVKTNGNAAAYEAYASAHVHAVTIPGCPAGKDTGRVFVGQRQDGFAVNLGALFDWGNLQLGTILDVKSINVAAANSIQDRNVTSLAIEVHKDCLLAGNEPVLGGWTTASVRQSQLVAPKPVAGVNSARVQGGAWTQVSRLGNPLVNELIIGLPQKDAFNASKPAADAQFSTFFSHPTLPALLGLSLSNNARALAPTHLPRTDVQQVLLTGVSGVNKPLTVTPADVLRLNTDIAPTTVTLQNRLGVLGELVKLGGVAYLPTATDLAGYPNGRRPKDDVVDIALMLMSGAACVLNTNADIARIVEGQTTNNNVLALNTFVTPGTPPTTATSDCGVRNVPLGLGSAYIHDGVDQAVVPFLSRFPFLNTPTPGGR